MNYFLRSFRSLDTFGCFRSHHRDPRLHRSQEAYTPSVSLVPATALFFTGSGVREFVRSVLVSGRQAGIITNSLLVSGVASLASLAARSRLSQDREPNSPHPDCSRPLCEYPRASCFVLRILVPIRPVLWKIHNGKSESRGLTILRGARAEIIIALGTYISWGYHRSSTFVFPSNSILFAKT